MNFPSLPTVRIASDKTDLGYVVINEADFNPKQHELYQEPEAASDEPKAPPVLTDVRGISPARQEQLAAVGVTTLEELVAADPKVIVDAVTGVAEPSARKWQTAAAKLIA